MAVQEVEYVELYTSSMRPTADYFASALGFTRVAAADDCGKDSVLLRQGNLQVVISAGPATHEFLDAHGDGIADIAMSCADVTAVRDAAAAAGAEVVGAAQDCPVVSGFGGVRHTLVPLPARAGITPPAGRAWTRTASPPAGPASGRIRLLDHVAVAVEGRMLGDYADFYTAGFGLERYSAEYVSVGDQAMDSIVVRNPAGGVTFTLQASDATKSPGQLDAFLDRNGGPGVQHLAFGVDDIILAVREFQARGVEFLSTPASYYDMLSERFADMRAEIADLRTVNVLADRDEWGYLLQLFTRSPYERNTLFYEVIQRRGARGFGSANIRALYEAVERDRQKAG